MNTVYEAKIGSATSKEVTVNVQPTIQLTKVGRHKFSVTVSAASSFAGKQVLFQRRKISGKWVTIKKVVLAAAAKSGPTTTTSATFTSKIRHRRVRISMALSQTSPCYAASRSAVIRS
ncbi:MAG: hypothetical protein ACXVRK_09625 [Gaiellaceae bacterium]